MVVGVDSEVGMEKCLCDLKNRGHASVGRLSSLNENVGVW